MLHARYKENVGVGIVCLDVRIEIKQILVFLIGFRIFYDVPLCQKLSKVKLQISVNLVSEAQKKWFWFSPEKGMMRLPNCNDEANPCDEKWRLRLAVEHLNKKSTAG